MIEDNVDLPTTVSLVHYVLGSTREIKFRENPLNKSTK